MRVMVIVKATRESEAESHPLEMEGAEEMFEQMGRFNEELVEAGIMLAGEGLKPSRFGKRIHFDGTRRSVTDGPFAETKELVAGYWIWQVKSMEEAVEWAKRCPNPMPGPSDLEIRPIWESEDFGPEIAARVLRSGERIHEVPIHYRARSREAGKKLTAADGLRVLRTLIRCRVM